MMCSYTNDICKHPSRKDEDNYCTGCLIAGIKENTDLLITAIVNLTASISKQNK